MMAAAMIDAGPLSTTVLGFPWFMHDFVTDAATRTIQMICGSSVFIPSSPTYPGPVCS